MPRRRRRASASTPRSLKAPRNFAPGETIRTEISRKFDLDEMAEFFRKDGLQRVESWTDAKRWFALALYRAA